MFDRLHHHEPWEGKVLELNKVRYVYPAPRAVVAIDEVSFSVDRGEYVAIVGQNGSGKTTLASCISTYLQPTEGTVRILGRDPFEISVSERPRFVGYVFQNPDQQLFKDTVRKDVAFGLENLRYTPEVVSSAVEAVLGDLELLDRAAAHPYQISKGDRQRLAVAVVAVMQPEILIIDEPTTGLDAARSHEVMNLCRTLRDQLQLTILVITHNMELVSEYCDRMIVIHEGNVLLDDEPSRAFGSRELLAQTNLAPPPVADLFLQLGLDPVPLRIDEAAARLTEAAEQ